MARRSSRGKSRGRSYSRRSSRNFSSSRSRGRSVRSGHRGGNTVRLVIHHTGIQQPGEVDPGMLRAKLGLQPGPKKASM